MKQLVIGKDGFSLPLTLVTSTQAILARKRSGKSYCASVEAEEMLENGQQVVVIDPTGAWKGLRSSADGKSEGYPVVVFGGDHADAPLDYRAGKAMALAVLEHGFSAIFDIGNFITDEQVQFVMDFSSELLRVSRTAIHVFMDEADTFAPQLTENRLQKQCLGATSRLVKQGGVRGIGVTMITQRPADINKKLLSQVDMLTVLRMSHPLDIAAAVEWIKSEVNPKFAEEVKAALPSLPVGTGFFCSASSELGIRVEVRQRRTFNSGATPKPGERKIEPKVLAQIDIQKLGEKIADGVKKERENSPEFLKKRIAELEASAAKVTTNSITPERERMLVEQINELQKTAGIYDKVMSTIYSQAATMQDAASKIKESIDELRNRPASVSPLTTQTVSQKKTVIRELGFAAPVPKEKRIFSDAIANGAETDLSGPEQRVINAIGWFAAIGISDPEQPAVAFMANYTVNSSSYKNPRGALSTKGFITLSNGRISLTRDGMRMVQAIDVPLTNHGLQMVIMDKLPTPEQRLLSPLIKKFPHGMTNDELSEAAGYSANSSSYKNPRGRLGTLGLTRSEGGKVFATDVLFPEVK